MSKLSHLSVILWLSVSSVFSQINFAPEVKRVAVFKNGYAFTFREGAANITDGWAYTNKTPIGVLGTVWGYSTAPNVRVQQLLAAEEAGSVVERVSNIAEFLLANEGKQIRVETQLGENPQVLIGTYQLLKPDAAKIAAMPNNNPYEAGFSMANLNYLTIVLKTENGVKVMPTQYLKSVEVVGEANLQIAKKGSRLGLRVEGAKNGESVNLGIAALERGIRWIPAYRVEVKGAPIKEAKLELEAMLINELTDLKNTEVNFVVGVPHFLFQDQMSPLSINTAFAGVSSYFQTGSRNNRRDAYSNALRTQVAYQTDSSNAEDAAPTVAAEEQTNSFSAEQLFLYKTDNINLKKGERSSLRLFSLTVPATEVFEWTINDAPDTQNRYLNYGGNYSNQQTPVIDLTSRVWSALRLKNTTGMPWTTAPALSFREWKPLGQDLLTFTPVGGDNILRVTPATEVIGNQTLEEKAREKVQLNYGGSSYNFDLVTIEGVIKIRNVKKEAIELVLTRNVVGEVIEAGDGGKTTKEGLNLQSFNPNSVIKWNLSLPSGEKEIRYSYKIYVRR